MASIAAADKTGDKVRGLKLMRLSAVAAERLEIYADLLRKWQTIENLVGPRSLDVLWTRHFADSAQLLDIMPEAGGWADLGSGAGFPGLVLAILLADRPGAIVHLVESSQRKCAFLREVSRETSAKAIIHCGRIETVVPTLDKVEAVTARGLAPLAILLTHAEPLLKKGGVGIFPKGRSVEAELTGLPCSDNFAVTLTASKTDPLGRIVVVRPATVPLPDVAGADRAR